jgi:V-type H+-transporting ATPase proteolipid subunit
MLLGGEACPYFAPFLGLGGAGIAMIFSAIGAAYGTAKSGIGISGLGQSKPELMMKSLIPVVMAGYVY